MMGKIFVGNGLKSTLKLARLDAPRLKLLQRQLLEDEDELPLQQLVLAGVPRFRQIAQHRQNVGQERMEKVVGRL